MPIYRLQTNFQRARLTRLVKIRVFSESGRSLKSGPAGRSLIQGPKPDLVFGPGQVEKSGPKVDPTASLIFITKRFYHSPKIYVGKTSLTTGCSRASSGQAPGRGSQDRECRFQSYPGFKYYLQGVTRLIGFYSYNIR